MNPYFHIKYLLPVHTFIIDIYYQSVFAVSDIFNCKAYYWLTFPG